MAHSTEAMMQRLPARTRGRLEELLTALRRALGDDLVAVVAHGSAVRGGYREDHSDVDLMVVLRDDASAKLASISDALLLARASARIEAMLLRADEIADSADVFPLLYADVKGCHAVLHGTDPFSAVKVHDDHVRLRVEQELRDVRIRLRRMIVDESGDAERLAGAVERKVRQLRSPLHALLRLKGRTVDDDVPTVYAAAAELTGVDTSPLLDVRAYPDAALAALRALLEKGVALVDGMGGRTP